MKKVLICTIVSILLIGLLASCATVPERECDTASVQIVVDELKQTNIRLTTEYTEGIVYVDGRKQNSLMKYENGKLDFIVSEMPLGQLFDINIKLMNQKGKVVENLIITNILYYKEFDTKDAVNMQSAMSASYLLLNDSALFKISIGDSSAAIGGSISGDISDFSDLMRLKYLALVNCDGISGDVGSLADMASLRSLYLRGNPNIVGSTDALTNIQVIDINDDFN